MKLRSRYALIAMAFGLFVFMRAQSLHAELNCDEDEHHYPAGRFCCDDITYTTISEFPTAECEVEGYQGMMNNECADACATCFDGFPGDFECVGDLAGCDCAS